MKTSNIVILIVMATVMAMVLMVGCEGKTEELNDVNDDGLLIFGYHTPFDYNNYVAEPNAELVSFTDGDYIVGLYVGKDGLIEIRYENCSPELGAKVVHRLFELFGKENNH